MDVSATIDLLPAPDVSGASDATVVSDVSAAKDAASVQDVTAAPDVFVAPDVTAPPDVTTAPDVTVAMDVPRPVCPVGQTLAVDNDVAGSGYREESANWATWATDACRVTYRYLSHGIGDGTRRGRAIWQPPIRTAGFYRVTTSYRQSTNRTNNADYYVEDDRGTRVHFDINQQMGSGCTRVDLGLAWCRPGGACRVVLIGDDGQSDSADETTFRLERCDDTAVPSPCAGISSHANYELCGESATTCAGVFNDGSGCTAFCAAAGMVCTARYGASVGCMRETASIPCGASNGHMSDWCECARR